MSVNRENITWQGKDKKWNLGFFAYEPVNEDSPDYDHEWDVEYDYNEFSHVFVGYPTPEAARAAWRGANPGTWEIITKYDKKVAEKYDRMAQFCLHPELKVEAEKKEKARLKRAHTKVLKQQFAENQNFQRDYVAVTLKDDDEPWTRFGATMYFTGYLSQQGYWLTIKGQRVFNTATGRPNPKLHKIEKPQSRYR